MKIKLSLKMQLGATQNLNKVYTSMFCLILNAKLN